MAPKLVFVLPVVLLGLALQAILRPPPQKLCGSPGGPPLTSPRIKLRDGRYLAYREDGVEKDKARYNRTRSSQCMRLIAPRTSPYLFLR